jgi:hypothetical protein
MLRFIASQVAYDYQSVMTRLLFLCTYIVSVLMFRPYLIALPLSF